MSTNQENIPPTSLKLKIPGKSHSRPVIKPQKLKAPKTPAKPPKQTKWSAENSAELIRVLTEQQAMGNQADNSWKGCVWTAAELALRDSELISGGAKKDAKKCSGHWDKLKSEFLSVQRLRSQSGWSWDESRHRVTAPDDVWDTHIAAHPEDKKWRFQSFPLYDEILPLVEGRHATGELVWHIPEMRASSVIGSEIGEVAEDESRLQDGMKEDEEDEGVISGWSPSPPPTARVMTPAAAKTKKRPATPTSTPSASATKRVRTSRVTNAGAVADVADALRDVATKFNTDSGGSEIETTPRRRTAAIRTAASDLNLSREQWLQVLHLFRDNIAAADAYLAIDDVELRTDFILGSL